MQKWLPLLLIFSFSIQGMEIDLREIKERDPNNEDCSEGQALYQVSKEALEATQAIIHKKLRPWNDITTIVGGYSIDLQLPLLGDVSISKTDYNELLSILANANNFCPILYMNKEAQERNPGLSALSTRYAIWVNPNAWQQLSVEERKNLIAHHLSINHDWRLLKSSIEFVAYTGMVGAGLYGAKKVLKSNNRRLPVLMALVGTTSVLHRMGFTNDFFRDLYRRGDIIPLTAKEEIEVNEKAQELFKEPLVIGAQIEECTEAQAIWKMIKLAGQEAKQGIINSVVRTGDSRNFFTFKAVPGPQIKKFGKEPVSMEIQELINPFFKAADAHPLYFALEMNEETQKRNNDVPIISTRFGMWFNPSVWPTLNKSEQQRAIAQQLSIPHDHYLLLNGAKLTLYATLLGVGVWKAETIFRSAGPKFRKITTGLVAADVACQLGFGRSVIRRLAFQTAEDDVEKLSEGQQRWVDQKAEGLLQNLGMPKPTGEDVVTFDTHS